MKVESFRELLFKKAKGDPTLQSFIKYVKDELIVNHALETLEKMARASHKGDTANFPVRDFATEMDPETEPHMMREALGHHVSQYKAALKSKNQGLANRHAAQAYKIMNLADRVQKHSGGKLQFEHISPHAWERNKFTNTYGPDHEKVKEGKYKPGDFTIKTKGLNYKGSDYSFLQQPPHKSYEKEIKRHGHNKAYPFEQIRINGKYIPVDENASVEGGTYKEHPFDSHPILRSFDDPVHKRTPEDDQRYVAERDKFYNESPHIENYFNRMSELENQDPEAFAQRGNAPAAPVHGDIEGLNIGGEAKPAEQAAAAPAAAPQAVPKSDELSEEEMKYFNNTAHPEVKKLIDALPSEELKRAVIRNHVRGKK
jgi:hypothetical protein